MQGFFLCVPAMDADILWIFKAKWTDIYRSKKLLDKAKKLETLSNVYLAIKHCYQVLPLFPKLVTEEKSFLYSAGVYPVSLRKHCIKWLCEEKPK